MTFRKILIANRGEIAIRIARAAADLQIGSVAVYAEDDADSLHVARADQALPLVGRGVRAYLDAEQLLSIARDNDCDALHPGYGFLSENAGFSRRCAEAGIAYIGATPELLDLLGNKASARQAAADAGLPLVPGLNRSCSLEDARTFFQELGEGAAVMIKALAGGGGRGMRAVAEAGDLETAYRQCRKEAGIAFGSEDVYVEQWLQAARHVEVQVLGDGSGRVAHAWERECTLQRRHQKLLEIGPSPTLDEATRASIIEASLNMAAALQFRGLGTFEFLIDADNPNSFYFMEVNPRIQVEHTVTEEITGLDLACAQIELAGGASLAELGLDSAPPLSGCAIQARINLEQTAEDGSTRPATGLVSTWLPPSGPGVRVDDCLYPGYRVNPAYDTLGAKLIVSGSDYPSTLRKLQRSLEEVRLEGVQSNLGFLQNLVNRTEVLANQVHTRFVEEHAQELAPSGDTGAGSLAAEPGTGELPGAGTGVRSPSAGTLIALDVRVGDEVHAGQAVATVEAMKMELTVEAPCDGRVTELADSEVGDTVDQDQLLALIEPGEVSGAHIQDLEPQDLDRVRPDLEEALARNARTLDEARPAAVERRHDHGKRTIRENLADLVDVDSFSEYGALVVAAQRSRHDFETLMDISPADGLIAGTATVNGDLFCTEAARCAVLGYDYTVMVGTQGIMGHRKTDRLIDLAKRLRLPLVLFAEGGGGRPSDTDHLPLSAATLNIHTFTAMSELSGLVPTVGIAAGYCFAGNTVLYGVCDVTIATRAASIGMAGPALIEGGGLGSCRPEDVGPAAVLAANGVIDLLVEDEAAAVAAAKQYLAYFQGDLETWESHDQRLLRSAVPENRKQAYDVRGVIDVLADAGSVLELRADFARSAVTALIRIEGRPLGLLANDPRYLGGAIDADAADKFARFMQLCDAHDLPILSLCDTPGFMVGPESERAAAVRHLARMFNAGGNASVPFFALVLRKSYGLGSMAMVGGGFARPQLAAAWPSGEFGAMGFEGAVRLAERKRLEAVEDPEERQALFHRLVDDLYEQGKALNAASVFEIDAVIDPMQSREWVSKALSATPRPPKRTGKKRPFVDTW